MDNERYSEALENDEPIEIEGLTLYPITMRAYRTFEAAKSALLIRQGSLPVEYAVMSYLCAIYAMDYDAYKETGKPLGFIAQTLVMLSLAMRFPVDALRRNMTYEVDPQDERKLKCLQLRVGENIIRITPSLFDRVRKMIADQNGLELPDESENTDLVEAEMDIAAAAGTNVEFDFRTMLASVARDQRCRRAELLDYTIREFTELRDAIERDKLFTIYRAAEIAGTVKFKNGNPYPSWCYDLKEKTNSLISMSEFMAGPGSVATMK